MQIPKKNGNFFLGMVIFHGSPEKFDANTMLTKLQEETEKRMQAEKQLRELERQISLSKPYIQRTQQSSLLIMIVPKFLIN